MVELTCIASHFQAARFLAVPEPGHEAVTISDALLWAIDRLRSKLVDYALGMGSQMVASNLPNSSYCRRRACSTLGSSSGRQCCSRGL
jgi:hypothetical protein